MPSNKSLLFLFQTPNLSIHYSETQPILNPPRLLAGMRGGVVLSLISYTGIDTPPCLLAGSEGGGVYPVYFLTMNPMRRSTFLWPSCGFMDQETTRTMRTKIMPGLEI